MFALFYLLLAAIAWAGPAEVTLWHAYRGGEREALEQLVERYNAESEAWRVVPLAVPYESFASKLEAAAPRGNGPDLFIAAHERVGAWSASGLIAPLEVSAAPYHPTTVEALSYKGALYGLPLTYKCLALFYNKALIGAPPRTTDELLEAAREFGGEDRFGLAYEATSAYHHAAWMHGFGGGVQAPDGHFQLDLPGNAEALAFARGLLEQGVIPEEPTGALVTQLFNEGRALFAINGPWFLGELTLADYGIAPLPVISETGAPAAPYLTVEGAMVSAYAANPEGALDFGRWLAGPEASVVRAVEGRQPVASLGAYEDPAVAGDPVLSAFRTQLDTARPMPNAPEMAATWEPQARALRRVMRGALTPEAAVSMAQQELEIVQRPPPPEADPRPWLALMVLVVVGGLGWLYTRLKAAGGFKELRRWSYAYLYAAPASISMLALLVTPFLLGAGVAFFSHREGNFTFVGMANFLDIILARDWSPTSELSFYYTLVVTVLWTVSNLVLHVGCGVALAMILREPWVRLRGVWRVLLILPWAVPNYITALIWKGMFHQQFGAINGVLVALGLEPVSWFSQWSTAFAANLTTNAWLGFPFMMVVTLGALQSIPRDLEQAAEVDGASGWQRFRHITLPLLAPALLPAIILGSVWTFNSFNIIYLVSAGEPDGGTEILISEAYRWAFTRGHRYGYAAAYALLIFFVLFGYSRWTQRMLGKKVI